MPSWAIRGRSGSIRGPNRSSARGSQFVSRNFHLWAYAHGVTLDFSRPGKPTDNAFIEASKGRFRAECVNAHWFLTLADAAEKLDACGR